MTTSSLSNNNRTPQGSSLDNIKDGTRIFYVKRVKDNGSCHKKKKALDQIWDKLLTKIINKNNEYEN